MSYIKCRFKSSDKPVAGFIVLIFSVLNKSGQAYSICVTLAKDKGAVVTPSVVYVPHYVITGNQSRVNLISQFCQEEAIFKRTRTTC